MILARALIQSLLLTTKMSAFCLTPSFVRSSWKVSSETLLQVSTSPVRTSSTSESSPERDKIQTAIRGPQNVLIYDTSLRDGTQGEAVSVSCNDKLKITERLHKFGVDYIEAGWPGSNPKDAEFFSRAQKELSAGARSKLVAFGSTRRKGVAVEEDMQVGALVDSAAPAVCLVAKAHKWQVTEILRAREEENLEMIYDTVKYLVSLGRKVYVDLEHFFDGCRYDSEYTFKCCEMAVKAGASGLVLCDTNGGSMPWEVDTMTREVVRSFPTAIVGIHCHNDCGMAVANSLSAAYAGAAMVQGTINGIGERTGNADLCSIVPSLALHMNSTLACNSNLANITKLSRFVDEILNRNPNPAAPFVGQSAFAHKGGLHVAAMERDPTSYQHIDPVLVGNEKRVLISELSGRQNIMDKIKQTGVSFGNATSERALAILERVKQLEAIGYTFEGADASVHLMILHMSKEYCPPFRVLDYSAQVFDFNLDSASRVLGIKNSNSRVGSARATVKVRTVDTTICSEDPYTDRLEVSDGNGPVDALASALTRALLPSHPILADIELVDYKVRILDPESATGAATRVMIEFRNKKNDIVWTTVSVDRNVISASLNALIDGFEYALLDLEHDCLLHH